MTGMGDPENRPSGPPGKDARARVADYLAGVMSEEDRGRLEREILEDETLAAALYEDVNIGEGLRVAAESGLPTDTRPAPAATRTRARAFLSRLQLRWAIPVAAAAMAVTVLLFSLHESGESPSSRAPVYRGQESRVDVIAPVGAVARPPDRFAWRPLKGAALYRVDIYDTEMILLLQTAVPETMLSLPIAGPSGAWKVTALASDGTPMGESAITRFEVALR